jgi:hypothetical protein
MEKPRKIEVFRTDDGHFNVYVGDECSDMLTWGEMIEQITSLTHPDIQGARARYLMQTETEWQAWRDRMRPADG